MTMKKELTCGTNDDLMSKVYDGADLINKTKTYRVKNLNWFCPECNIYCNSESQFDVHMISQKHKFVVDEDKRKLSAEHLQSLVSEQITDENNNLIENDLEIKIESEAIQSVHSKTNFSITEIAQNPIAIRFNINAVNYLITEEKRQGKFEKFGFYCKTCDAYMTGQIQLIMHVRGAKHHYFHPNEIPDYKPSKLYNPCQQSKKRPTSSQFTVDDARSLRNRFFTTMSHQSKNQPKNKQIVNFNEPSSKNEPIYSNCPQNRIKTCHENLLNTSSPIFNETNQYNFSNQVTPIAYNFKMHPVYAYQMMTNQRQKQNVNQQQTSNLNELSNLTEGQTNQKYSEIPNQSENFIQYNGRYEYLHYNQNVIPYSNLPSSPFVQKPNIQQHLMMTNQLKYGQNQTPVPYLLPQTPPNSFNQTPTIVQTQMHVQPQRKTTPHESEKVFNSYNVFNTPPGNFSYYPGVQHPQ